MKITRSQLRRLIKEETNRVLETSDSVGDTDGDGDIDHNDQKNKIESIRNDLNNIKRHLTSNYGPNIHTPIPMDLDIISTLIGAAEDILDNDLQAAEWRLQRHLAALQASLTRNRE